MQIEFDKDLSALNTLAIVSRAEAYVCATSHQQLNDALYWARANKTPVVVLGGGSNVLCAGIINAIVVQPKIAGIELIQESADDLLVRVGAGENWHSLVRYCVANRYYGLENLALIPGDVGAAPIQNIGAYGVEVKDFFDSLQALSIDTGKLETFTYADCKFAYRDSVFKNSQRSRYIIVSVTLRLSRHSTVNCQYPALQAELLQRNISAPTPEDVFNVIVSVRRRKLPDPRELPNAGSFFKNPVVSQAQFARLQTLHPAIAGYDAGVGFKKIAAAWLIDAAGWKGKTLYGIEVHKSQALVLVNPLNKPAANLLAMAEAIAEDIKTRFDVCLEVEPQILGKVDEQPV